MRVVEAIDFGGPDVLVARDAPDPVPGPGQVVVEVALADVLFLDTQLRAGWGRGFFPLAPPYVPGDGVAGTAGGRRVIARTGTQAGESGGIAPTGGYAERAVVDADALIDVPDGLGLDTALALLHDGPTALGLIRKAALEPGEQVLITAAGGSLGLVLVQLAKAAGARVIGAARGEAKLSRVLELGAEAAVDYSRPGWAGEVGEVDVVFDGAGGEIGRDAFKATTATGRFFAYGAASGDFAPIAKEDIGGRTVVGITDDAATPDEVLRMTEDAVAEAAAGRLRPVIGQTYPLQEAAAAHAAIAARTAIGKTLLVI